MTTSSISFPWLSYFYILQPKTQSLSLTQDCNKLFSTLFFSRTHSVFEHIDVQTWGRTGFLFESFRGKMEKSCWHLFFQNCEKIYYIHIRLRCSHTISILKKPRVGFSPSTNDKVERFRPSRVKIERNNISAKMLRRKWNIHIK